jgi:hypothetical protein
MPILDDKTSPAKRGLVLLGGLAAALLLLLLTVLIARFREGPAGARTARRAPAAETADPEVETPLAALPAPAPAAAEAADVAAAMDLAGARGLLVALMDAAAQGNRPLEDSAVAGLRRYGTRVRPLIDEQRALASHDGVRAALDRARAAAR